VSVSHSVAWLLFVQFSRYIRIVDTQEQRVLSLQCLQGIGLLVQEEQHSLQICVYQFDANSILQVNLTQGVVGDKLLICFP